MFNAIYPATARACRRISHVLRYVPGFVIHSAHAYKRPVLDGTLGAVVVLSRYRHCLQRENAAEPDWIRNVDEAKVEHSWTDTSG